MKKTIICHFYNEEYLLPWWLKHHREIFEDGIMINYKSNDNSIEIIKSLCPSWKIVDTKNQFFGAIEIDKEVEEYEKKIDGPRIALNVTEFLVGNISKLRPTIKVPVAHMVDPPELHNTYPDQNKPLTKQRLYGINPNNKKYRFYSRIFHENKNISYSPGRHYWEQGNINDFMILKYKHSPWNDLLIKRKMQIGEKQPESDLRKKWGIQHQFDLNQLNKEKKEYLACAEDITSLVTKFEYWKHS